jgi:hypothetical protein
LFLQAIDPDKTSRTAEYVKYAERKRHSAYLAYSAVLVALLRADLGRFEHLAKYFAKP